MFVSNVFFSEIQRNCSWGRSGQRRLLVPYISELVRFLTEHIVNIKGMKRRNNMEKALYVFALRLREIIGL